MATRRRPRTTNRLASRQLVSRADLDALAEAVRELTALHRRTVANLEVQFKRIAQLQAEVDRLKKAIAPGALSEE